MGGPASARVVSLSPQDIRTRHQAQAIPSACAERVVVAVASAPPSCGPGLQGVGAAAAEVQAAQNYLVAAPQVQRPVRRQLTVLH